MYFQYQKLTFTEEITDINQIQRSVGSSTTMKMDSKQNKLVSCKQCITKLRNTNASSMSA